MHYFHLSFFFFFFYNITSKIKFISLYSECSTTVADTMRTKMMSGSETARDVAAALLWRATGSGTRYSRIERGHGVADKNKFEKKCLVDRVSENSMQ